MLRSFLRRLHKSERSATAPAGAASRKLRQRVLRTVRSEAPVYPHARGLTPRAVDVREGGQRAQLPHLAVLAVFALVLTGAAALIAGATLPSSHRPITHAPLSGAATPARAPATHAQLLVTGARTELVVSGMPQPPIGEIYELWLIRASSPVQPTDALFTVTHAGDGAVQVPGQLRHVREIMVTSEPLGGSSSPTSAAVLRLPVAH